MRPDDLLVRCLLRREDGHWCALCVDFDLAAQADSPDGARRLLCEQIASYVQEALTIDREHAVRLLHRRAPLRKRALHAALSVVARAPLSTTAYIEPLPVLPRGA